MCSCHERDAGCRCFSPSNPSRPAAVNATVACRVRPNSVAPGVELPSRHSTRHPSHAPSGGPESHLSHRAAWLGANDGIVSTASLMLGVAATSASTSAVVTAGFAGLVGGSLSMASGEYVSVSSQRDSERADLEAERQELEDFPEAELRELTEIYVRRGLDRELAREVARQLHRHDALGAHLRDELNLSVDEMANPVQAAVTSAVSFSLGAAIPLLVGWWTRGGGRLLALALAALVGLAAIGAIGARLGGALGGRAAARVLIGGGLAMAITTLIGRLVGVVG